MPDKYFALKDVKGYFTYLRITSAGPDAVLGAEEDGACQHTRLQAFKPGRRPKLLRGGEGGGGGGGCKGLRVFKAARWVENDEA